MGGLSAGRLALQVLILAMLGACAGGGGGGGGGGGVVSPPLPPVPSGTPRPPPVAVPPAPPPAAPGTFPSAGSAEYSANWGVAGSGAISAWQHGARGQGVLVGVIDDGIVANTDPAYVELQGRIDPRSIDIRSTRNQLSSANTHGAELASLIAGNFNGQYTVGVAYEATILAVRADNGGGTFNTDDLANALDYAVANGVKVVNFSLGSANPTGAAFQAALRNATQAGVIIVVSAGNDGPVATQPNYPGFLAGDPSISNGLLLIAGGLNADGTFNNRSNPAGTTNAANFYLTAPGWEINVPDFGAPGPLMDFQVCSDTLASSGPCASNMVRIQGTSYASPHVTGAIALLMSAFPGLTPQQVVTIILQSTDDMGAAGIDSQTGWGRLNVAKAFAPIGTVSAPVSGQSFEIESSTTLGMAGPAFGDGLSDDAGEWAMVGFDSFDRPYKVDLTVNWARAPAGPSIVAEAPRLWRTSRTPEGVSFSLAAADSVAPDSLRTPLAREEIERPAVRIEGEIAAGLTLAFAADGVRAMDDAANETVGHLGFVNSDQSLRLTRSLGNFASVSLLTERGEGRVGLMQERSERTATAARAAFGTALAGFDVTYGRMVEEQGLMGLVWTDMFGETPRGEVRFAGFGAHYAPVANWRFIANVETGAAELAQQGWISVGEPLRTSAFSLQAAYAATPDWFDLFGAGSAQWTLTLSQPMRVEAGTLNVSLPTATAYGRRSLSFETRAIDPTPSGREMRVGLGYSHQSPNKLSAFGEALYVLEPGHVAQADPSAILRFGFRVRR